jgi:riboflavin kinase/FMN adenylyltransferase
VKRGRLVTIGSFDGVHRGHQALLSLTIQEAKKRQLKSTALTFQVPPKMILNPNQSLSLLNTRFEKEWLIRKFGIDEVSFLDFSRKISRMKAFHFFKQILLEKYSAKGVVVGADFRFGNNRNAGAVELVRWGQEYGIPVWVVPPVKWQGQVVSSSRIRQYLDENRYIKAINLLGHCYSIEGPVIHGRKLGGQLGFPTANLKIETGKYYPTGVYAVDGEVFQRKGSMCLKRADFKGVCNIGYRPTINKGKSLNVEVHMFRKNGNFYGKTILIRLIKRLRGEKKFKNIEDLKIAIKNDVKAAERVLNKEKSKVF